MSKRASLHNLGCKVNAYETEAMQQLLEEAGYEIVPFGEAAEVCIINTCSVTNVADKKSRQMLHRAKAKNPEAVVVAAGCYVQAAADELKKDGAVDLIIGNNKKTELVTILAELFAEREKEEADRPEGSGGKAGAGSDGPDGLDGPSETDSRETAGAQKPGAEQTEEEKQDRKLHLLDIAHTEEYEELTIHHVAEHTRAFIKVQDGCNQFCSYCIIPYTRGRVRSRKPETVIAEIKELVAQGYREVVLTGIHLSSYGIDWKKAAEKTARQELSGTTAENQAGQTESPELDWKTLSGAGMPLLSLIRSVNEIEGLERIRLGSLEPRIVTEEFVKELASMPKLCPHFHLSLQSGCGETLKRMNRHYTPEQYLEGCRILRAYFDNPAITTDVIVGFPGETEADFEESKAFTEQVHFYEMHVFPYSRRAGTRAAVMENQVPEQEKSRRSASLLALERQMSAEYRNSFSGKENQILLEELQDIGGEACMTGYTKEYVRMAVKLSDLDPSENWRGRLVSGIAEGFLKDDMLCLKPEFAKNNKNNTNMFLPKS